MPNQPHPNDLPEPLSEPMLSKSSETRPLGRPVRPPIPEALVQVPEGAPTEIAPVLSDTVLSDTVQVNAADTAVAKPSKPAWLPVGLGIAALTGVLGVGGLLLTQRTPQQTGVVIPSGGDGQTISGAAVPAGKLGAPTQPQHDSPPIQQPPKPVPVQRVAPKTDVNTATNTISSAVDTAPVQAAPVTPINNTYTAPTPVQNAQTPITTPAAPETTEPPSIDTTPIATPETNSNASTSISSTAGQTTVATPASGATNNGGAVSSPATSSPTATTTAPTEGSAATNTGQPATTTTTTPEKTPEKPASTQQPASITPVSEPVEIPATPLTLPESAPKPTDTNQTGTGSTGQVAPSNEGTASAQGALGQ